MNTLIFLIVMAVWVIALLAWCKIAADKRYQSNLIKIARMINDNRR